MRNSAILTALLAVVAVGAQAQTNQLATEPDPDKRDIVVGGSAKVQANLTFFPVLHIELGSGATEKNGMDVVNLSLNTVDAYQTGIYQKVPKQLKIFSIGSDYTLKASLAATPETEIRDALHKIVRFGIAPTGVPVQQKRLSEKADLLQGTPEGLQEMDAAYWILAANSEDRIQAFNTLLGKDGMSKKYTVDITYTIAPN